MSINDYVKCEHCLMQVSPGETEFLAPPLCTIMEENEIFQVCEYCTGYRDEAWYWNDWVLRKRQERKTDGKPG